MDDVRMMRMNRQPVTGQNSGQYSYPLYGGASTGGVKQVSASPLSLYSGNMNAATAARPPGNWFNPPGNAYYQTMQPCNCGECTSAYAASQSQANFVLDQVGIIDHPMDDFPLRIDAIKKAKRSIYIQTFHFNWDEPEAYVAELLKIKKREGVDVKIFVEPLGNFAFAPQFSKKGDILKDLLNAGIEIIGFEPSTKRHVWEHVVKHPFTLNKRFHEKYLVIDGDDDRDGVAILGSANWAREYYRFEDPKGKWFDQNLVLKGPTVKEIQETFIKNWMAMTSGPRGLKKITLLRSKNREKRWNQPRDEIMFPRNHMRTYDLSHEYDQICRNGRIRGVFTSQDPQKVAFMENLFKRGKTIDNVEYYPTQTQFVLHRPRAHEKNIDKLYLRMVQEARKEIILINYNIILDPPLKKAIQDAARRGVQVYLMSNSPQSNDSVLKPLKYEKSFPSLIAVNDEPETIRNHGGIHLYEWIGPRMGDRYLHSKFGIFDYQQAVVGSYNIDKRSREDNSENVLVFEGNAALKLRDNAIYYYFPRSEVRDKSWIMQNKDINNPVHFLSQVCKGLAKNAVEMWPF